MFRWPGGQIDAQQGRDLAQDLGAALLKQKREQIVLPRLPEDHPVDGKGPLERLELRRVLAQGERRYMPLDVRSVREREEPVGDEPTPLR